MKKCKQKFDMGGGQVKKLKNFLLTDVKIINKYLLVTIILVILCCVGLTSYALFSYEVEQESNIKVVYNPPVRYYCDTINEDTSNANNPKNSLPTNMIPVCYDSEREVWRKADVNNTKKGYKWYSYSDKVWANAVTVSDSNTTTEITLNDGTIKSCDGTCTREDYVNSEVGTIIPMEVINTMWVWIPRFSATGDTANYNGGTIDNHGAFDITFVSKTTTAHDAFTFGTQSLNGIWIGKFETSHKTLSSNTTENNLGCTNDTCSNANGIIIKPNVKSLKRNNVSNFYYAILSMKQSGNSFGFDITKDTTLDTHMVKNNEWGAVAYLTQSIYGRCTSSTSCTEVYINNSSSGYYTGRSGGNAGGSTPINGTYPDQTSTTQYNTYGFYTYDGYLLDYGTNNKSTTKDISKVASTTGNIYGVYDMSGGAHEYVMGVYTDGTQNWSGTNSIFNSEFSGCLGSSCSSTYDGVAYPESKYYNSYTTSTNYTNAGLQHAIVETKNWFGDFASFVNGNYPWFLRGGYYGNGSSAGVFCYYDFNGCDSDSDYSSRSSLIIN